MDSFRQVWGYVGQTMRVGLCVLLSLGMLATPVYARSLSDILQTKELRICIAPLHPAYSTAEPSACRDNCKFSGPVYEEALVFAKSLGKGVHAKVQRVEWDEQFFNKDGKTVNDASYTPELLASGKCDLYPNKLTKNEWRLKKLDFVIVFPNRMMVIAAKPMKGGIKTVADLAGKTVAVEKNTSWHTWLNAQNQTSYFANPVRFSLLSTQESFAAVEAAKVDFTVADSDMAMWSARHQFKNAATAFPVGPADEIGWAFRKEDKDLQAAVQKFFDVQRKNPSSDVNNIWKAHFGRTLTEFIALMAAVK
jgi:membrane-bound lytic murein transglycosylase F